IVSQDILALDIPLWAGKKLFERQRTFPGRASQSHASFKGDQRRRQIGSVHTETAMAAHDREVILIWASHCRAVRSAFLQARRQRTPIIQTPGTLAQIAT